MNLQRLFFTILAISFSGYSQGQSQKITWREEPAIVPSMEQKKCMQASTQEADSIELAARIIELDDPADAFGWLKIGAKKTLGNHVFVWDKKKRESSLICVDQNIYQRVGIALARQGGLGKHRLVEYELMLVSKIVKPPEVLINDVARVAFSDAPSQSEIFVDLDIRPLARAILATYGHQAKPFADQAFTQMDSRTASGTGASQIAVAAGHPLALEKTLRLIDDLLVIVSADKAIPWHVRNRLYELVSALTYSTEKTPERVAAVEKIMSRKVQSNATMFGMVDLSPKRMCAVMTKISPSYDLKKFPYCFSDQPDEQ